MTTRRYPPRQPTAMPPCPICGQPVRAVVWLLVIERPDDGKHGICKYLLYCATDGARWKWADRPDDEWTYDQVSTDYHAKRLAASST